MQHPLCPPFEPLAEALCCSPSLRKGAGSAAAPLSDPSCLGGLGKGATYWSLDPGKRLPCGPTGSALVWAEQREVSRFLGVVGYRRLQRAEGELGIIVGREACSVEPRRARRPQEGGHVHSYHTQQGQPAVPVWAQAPPSPTSNWGLCLLFSLLAVE